MKKSWHFWRQVRTREIDGNKLMPCQGVYYRAFRRKISGSSHFSNVCKEEETVSLEDGSHTLFLSTCGENEEEVAESLVKFLKYVKAELGESTGDFQDEFVQRLQDAVRNVKASREMEERYMLLEEMLKDEREAGRIEGKAEDVLELLSDLGEVPGELCEKIRREKDLDILKSYLRKASASKTIEEFQTLIEQQD